MFLFGVGCGKKEEPPAPAKKEEPKRTAPALAQYDYLWDTQAPPVIKDSSDWMIRPDASGPTVPDAVAPIGYDEAAPEVVASAVEVFVGDVSPDEVQTRASPAPAVSHSEVKVIKAQQALVAEYGDSVEVLQKDAEELKKLMVQRRQSMGPKAYSAWRARLSLHLQKLEPELRTANPD